jgi:hypothetical protein
MQKTLYDKKCDAKHTYCIANGAFFSDPKNITSLNVDKYISTIITNISYNNCLSTYYNRSHDLVIKTIIKLSETQLINADKVVLISQQLTDSSLCSIVKNQIKLNSNYGISLMTSQVTTNYGVPTYIINICAVGKKIETLKVLLDNFPINTFFSIIKNLRESNDLVDNIICEYLNKNDKTIELKFFSDNLPHLINKPKILALVYKLISLSMTSANKLELLNKVVGSYTLDLSLILNILEGNDVVPTQATLTNLLAKVYIRKGFGAPNNKIIAQVIDIFILYGFKITKRVVKDLLSKGCYINQIEKYSITIDNEILNECSIAEYYPYEFSCLPSEEIMIRECSRESNLETIKKFKEKGGEINVKCLEKACGVRKNGKTIKYMIVDCGVKPNDACLTNYSLANGIEGLDIIMKNYSKVEPEKPKPTNVIIDNSCTMTIERKDIIIDKNSEYVLKNKVRKFFNCEKKNIKYLELYELMLKYLIEKKLVIGNYFLVNEQLENLIKINQCTIIHIDQLDNILTYFVDLIKTT